MHQPAPTKSRISQNWRKIGSANQKHVNYLVTGVKHSHRNLQSCYTHTYSFHNRQATRYRVATQTQSRMGGGNNKQGSAEKSECESLWTISKAVRVLGRRHTKRLSCR